MAKKGSVLGLDKNVEGLLCYVLGFISGIFFLVTEKKDKFIRFHAMQSTILFGILFIAHLVFTGIFFWSFYLIITLLQLVIFILWLFLMYKAYQGEKYKFPIVGDIAEKHTK